MESLKSNKIIWAAIGCLNAIFLVYYCGLAINMRLHFDDIHWLYSAQIQNLWEYLQWVWYDRSGRMTVYAMNWIFSTVTLKVGVYWFWPILYMLFGWLLLWIFVRELPIRVANWQKYLLLVLIYNVYILTAVDFAVFYWPCAMQYYIIGPATLAIVGYALRKELKWYQWIFALFVVCLVGLGYEYWILIALLILFFVGLYYWKSEQWDVRKTWAQPEVRRIILFAILLLIGFLITISAPGMYKRVEGGAEYEGMVHPDTFTALIIAYSKTIATLLYFQAFYIPYYLILLVVMMAIGRYHAKTNTNNKILKVVSCALVIVIAVACVEPAYIYGGFGIQRFYTPLILLITIYFAFVGYILGGCYAKKVQTAGIQIVGITALSCMAIIMLVNICYDFPVAKRYAEAVDQRKEYVLSMQQQNYSGVLELDKIDCPCSIDSKYVVFSLLGKHTLKPALYYYSDVEDSPNDYSVFTRKAFHLDFDIVPRHAE